jgi:hypothetical protein
MSDDQSEANPMAGVSFGVLAVPGTEVRGRTNCNHPKNRRREGERMSLVYGSAPTEECTLCGAWRPTDRWLGPWRRATVSRGDRDDE